MNEVKLHYPLSSWGQFHACNYSGVPQQTLISVWPSNPTSRSVCVSLTLYSPTVVGLVSIWSGAALGRAPASLQPVFESRERLWRVVFTHRLDEHAVPPDLDDPSLCTQQRQTQDENHDSLPDIIWDYKRWVKRSHLRCLLSSNQEWDWTWTTVLCLYPILLSTPVLTVWGQGFFNHLKNCYHNKKVKYFVKSYD